MSTLCVLPSSESAAKAHAKQMRTFARRSIKVEDPERRRLQRKIATLHREVVNLKKNGSIPTVHRPSTGSAGSDSSMDNNILHLAKLEAVYAANECKRDEDLYDKELQMRKLKHENTRLTRDLKELAERLAMKSMEHHVGVLARQNDCDIIGRLRKKTQNYENHARKMKERNTSVMFDLESVESKVVEVEAEKTELIAALQQRDAMLAEMQRKQEVKSAEDQQRDAMLDELCYLQQVQNDTTELLHAHECDNVEKLRMIEDEKRYIERQLKEEQLAHESTKREMEQYRYHLHASHDIVQRARLLSNITWTPRLVTNPPTFAVSTPQVLTASDSRSLAKLSPRTSASRSPTLLSPRGLNARSLTLLNPNATLSPRGLNARSHTVLSPRGKSSSVTLLSPRGLNMPSLHASHSVLHTAPSTSGMMSTQRGAPTLKPFPFRLGARTPPAPRCKSENI